MAFAYTTQGTCSRKISFDVVDGKVQNVVFMGGCNGNQKGISALVEGQPVEEVINRLKGITCGPRPTSCPDQLACALHCYLDQQQHRLRISRAGLVLVFLKGMV